MNIRQKREQNMLDQLNWTKLTSIVNSSLMVGEGIMVWLILVLIFIYVLTKKSGKKLNMLAMAFISMVLKLFGVLLNAD